MNTYYKLNLFKTNYFNSTYVFFGIQIIRGEILIAFFWSLFKFIKFLFICILFIHLMGPIYKSVNKGGWISFHILKNIHIQKRFMRVKLPIFGHLFSIFLLFATTTIHFFFVRHKTIMRKNYKKCINFICLLNKWLCVRKCREKNIQIRTKLCTLKI